MFNIPFNGFIYWGSLGYSYVGIFANEVVCITCYLVYRFNRLPVWTRDSVGVHEHMILLKSSKVGDGFSIKLISLFCVSNRKGHYIGLKWWPLKAKKYVSFWSYVKCCTVFPIFTIVLILPAISVFYPNNIPFSILLLIILFK